MENHSSSIVVAARDTDVLVLLLAHFPKMPYSKIRMKAGTATKRKYIPIHSIVDKLSLDDALTSHLDFTPWLVWYNIIPTRTWKENMLESFQRTSSSAHRHRSRRTGWPNCEICLQGILHTQCNQREQGKGTPVCTVPGSRKSTVNQWCTVVSHLSSTLPNCFVAPCKQEVSCPVSARDNGVETGRFYAAAHLDVTSSSPRLLFGIDQLQLRLKMYECTM